jgi:hypothetical protein
VRFKNNKNFKLLLVSFRAILAIKILFLLILDFEPVLSLIFFFNFFKLFFLSCGCGNSYNAHGLHPNKTYCDTPCKGNFNQKCGGNNAITKSFFKINCNQIFFSVFKYLIGCEIFNFL